MKRKLYFEETLAMASMALLVLITLANVLTRYFTDQSFAWTEEISVFLLVIMTFAGAASAAGRDQHIRIEFLYESGSAERRRRLQVFSACCTALLFLILALLFSRTWLDEYKWAETTMGLNLPRWWFSTPLPILCLVIALRALLAAWKTSPQTEGGTQ
jgi:TRAP-type C4-dicarboxylate transport system permease small subunit